MSVARPVRSLLSRGLAATCTKPGVAAPTILPLRYHAPFHSSAPLEKRKPRFKSVRAEEMGLLTPEDVEEFTKQTFPEYTREELAILRKRYTRKQMEALMAGEAAIDPKDLSIQGRLREDPYRHPYLDDFSRVLPIVDKRPKTQPMPAARIKYKQETRDNQEFIDAAAEHLTGPLENTPDGGTKLNPEAHLALTQLLDDPNMLKNAPSNSAQAYGLNNQIPGVSDYFKAPEASVDPKYAELAPISRATGIELEKLERIQRTTNKVIVSRWVVNQTRLGKIASTWCLAIAGNRRGYLGIGVSKNVDMETATDKARLFALANMKPIRRYENRTIYGTVQAKVGATIVKLEARPPGFGIRASHRIFEICRAAGIEDIAAKMPRGRNPMNSVKACVIALQNQPDPEKIAMGRGKKLVDLRKVYHGQTVL